MKTNGLDGLEIPGIPSVSIHLFKKEAKNLSLFLENYIVKNVLSI